MTSITEYAITSPPQRSAGNDFFGTTGGPDGNVYLTDTLNNAIGRISSSGAITKLPLSPYSGESYFKSGLDGITLGFNNEPAFTESTHGVIGVITTEGSYTRSPIDPMGKATGQGPDQITTASDGTLWWTEDDANAIGEMTTAGVVNQCPVAGATNGGLGGSAMNGITVGSDGNIWFTCASNGNGFVGMITSMGNITELPLPSDVYPHRIADGPDGNFWVADSTRNKIDVMATWGSILHQYPVPVPTGVGGLLALTDITVGSDKNSYFTEGFGNIGEITTTGSATITPVSATVHTAGASGPQPEAITSGPAGNPWFSDPWTKSIGVLEIVSSPVPTPTTATPTTPTPTAPPTQTPTPTSSTVLQITTSRLSQARTLTPSAALSPLFVTRTILTVRPGAPRPGPLVTLVAAVKLTHSPREMSTGSVTFLNGTTELGVAPLGHGKARSVTSGLLAGRNRIEVQYSWGKGMAPSSASVMETIRRRRSRSQVTSSRELSTQFHGVPRQPRPPSEDRRAPKKPSRPSAIPRSWARSPATRACSAQGPNSISGDREWCPGVIEWRT